MKTTIQPGAMFPCIQLNGKHAVLAFLVGATIGFIIANRHCSGK